MQPPAKKRRLSAIEKVSMEQLCADELGHILSYGDNLEFFSTFRLLSRRFDVIYYTVVTYNHVLLFHRAIAAASRSPDQHKLMNLSKSTFKKMAVERILRNLFLCYGSPEREAQYERIGQCLRVIDVTFMFHRRYLPIKDMEFEPYCPNHKDKEYHYEDTCGVRINLEFNGVYKAKIRWRSRTRTDIGLIYRHKRTGFNSVTVRWSSICEACGLCANGNLGAPAYIPCIRVEDEITDVLKMYTSPASRSRSL